mgnify:CR=1 FL=1|tara:strand:- start:24 stop:191 length:168 start_codon:yes stop_codon:yes gene_type:complete
MKDKNSCPIKEAKSMINRLGNKESATLECINKIWKSNNIDSRNHYNKVYDYISII